MKLSLALFALAACQDAPMAQEATAPTAASDNSYGYEAPQEAAPVEAPQESYAAEPAAYAAPQAFVVRAPKVCVVCDTHSPCWNGATCAPKTYEAPRMESYAAPARMESYAAPAAPVEYGAQAESGYRRLAGYGDEAEAAPAQYDAQEESAQYDESLGSCPCGSFDTRFYRVHSNVILWVTFGLLFVPFAYFFCMAATKHDDEDAGFNSVRFTACIVCAVASLAYLTMALGYGYVTKCNGRDFYYARYIDWAITTPIMLYEIAKLSDRDTVTMWFLVLMDIFMIVSGLVGELIEGSERWAFFGFSMLAFLPVMYFVCVMYSIVSPSGGCGTDGITLGNHGHCDSKREEVVRRIAGITLLTWAGYPIIWILASVHGSSTSCSYAAGYATEAAQSTGYRGLQYAASSGVVRQAGVISVQGETYAYSVLDIIAKSLMGFVLVCTKYDNTDGCLWENVSNPSYDETRPVLSKKE